jgi:regulator of sirC expression with transglutaminase-like and TPR domain
MRGRRDVHSELMRRVQPFGESVRRRDGLDVQMATISHALQPEVEPSQVVLALDELAAACPTPTRAGVVGWLFADGRLVGDRTDYHGWRNSSLHQVLARSRGMPITLSIVAVEVARRLGVGLVGVGMPGHFIVGDGADPEWFADPFHRRSGLGRGDCRALYLSMGGSNWDDAMLAPTPDRAIVIRVLNNLRVSCERDGDAVRLAIVMQLRQQLSELAVEGALAARARAILN